MINWEEFGQNFGGSLCTTNEARECPDNFTQNFAQSFAQLKEVAEISIWGMSAISIFWESEDWDIGQSRREPWVDTALDLVPSFCVGRFLKDAITLCHEIITKKSENLLFCNI